jgi:hypothetical protein
MESYIYALGLAEYLNKPVEHDWDGETEAGLRKDSTLLHEIRTSLDPEDLSGLMEHRHAADLWRAFLEVKGMHIVHSLVCILLWNCVRHCFHECVELHMTVRLMVKESNSRNP